MQDPAAQWLVETDWLERHLSAPDVIVLDGSWHLPGSGRDARAEYDEAHIPGAVFFDIDEIADTDSPLPHMLPSPVKFSSRMRAMGVGDGSRIVVYDRDGLYSAARVWWMFRVMGFDDVAVLNGGFAKWQREDRPTEDGLPPPRVPKHFTARRRAELVRDLGDVEAALSEANALILDARPRARFTGEVPEPREGVQRGHIPGARSLPYSEVLQEDGRLKPVPELRALFEQQGVGNGTAVITTCGSGVTAAILALALAVSGHRRTAVYDGSWAEWGGDPDRPAEAGEGQA